MNIDDTIEDLIKREGGYSNNPNDKGGETNWGITVAVARSFGYTGAMALMPKATAAQIYRSRYWEQPGFDKVNALNALVAEELLDTGVNMGTGTAGKFLQRALNTLNYKDAWPSITVDGAVGKMTLYALQQFLLHRGVEGINVMLRMLNSQQSVKYMELAESNPNQKQFEYGWQLNRVR